MYDLFYDPSIAVILSQFFAKSIQSIVVLRCESEQIYQNKTDFSIK